MQLWRSNQGWPVEKRERYLCVIPPPLPSPPALSWTYHHCFIVRSRIYQNFKSWCSAHPESRRNIKSKSSRRIPFSIVCLWQSSWSDARLDWNYRPCRIVWRFEFAIWASIPFSTSVTWFERNFQPVWTLRVFFSKTRSYSAILAIDGVASIYFLFFYISGCTSSRDFIISGSFLPPYTRASFHLN